MSKMDGGSPYSELEAHPGATISAATSNNGYTTIYTTHTATVDMTAREPHPLAREQRLGTNCEEYEAYGCPVDGCPQICYLALPKPWDVEQTSAAFLARLERQPADIQRAAIHQLREQLDHG